MCFILSHKKTVGSLWGELVIGRAPEAGSKLTYTLAGDSFPDTPP